jgi:hypothetical protein
MTSVPNPTSYFSTPAPTLDPTLFEGRGLRSWVRQGITSLLYGFLNQKYRHAEMWAHPWLAGSGVSYQWSAARQPGDLDCLVGVNYEQFRKANPEFRGLSDKEISNQLNDDYRNDLQPQTENWNGYELTFFTNPGATDIRAIKPYAAYDLQYDEWTVYPDPSAQPPHNKAWDNVALADYNRAQQISTRLTAALNDAQVSHNDANRRNAEARMMNAVSQGSALYDEIHLGRSQAFSPSGEGYADFYNYRWQAGKRSGAIDLLRKIKGYGGSVAPEMPDASTLIRRAATYYA